MSDFFCAMHGKNGQLPAAPGVLCTCPFQHWYKLPADIRSQIEEIGRQRKPVVTQKQLCGMGEWSVTDGVVKARYRVGKIRVICTVNLATQTMTYTT